MSNDLIFQEIEVFQLSPKIRKSWNDYVIWKVIYSYPKPLRVKFEDLREGIDIYINEGYSKALFAKCHLNEVFWKSFSYLLSKNQNLELSFRKSGGLQGDIGLEWCQHKIQSYYRKYHKRPHFLKNSIFPAMRYVCLKGNFSKYGINIWSDLLCSSLPDVQIRPIKGIAGLERIREIFKNYYQKKGTVPSPALLGFTIISKAFRKGYWKEYDISLWGDLISDLFQPTEGYEGLQQAKRELQLYYEENKQTPAPNYFAHTNLGIKKEYWVDFGIHKWYDILRYAYGSSYRTTHAPFS